MRIILATGGSGGHLFPAMKVAQQIRALGHDVHFIGSFRLGKDKLLQAEFSFDDLNVKGLVFNNPVKLFVGVVALIKETFNCLRRLKELHAKKVIGFGGYGSFPAVMAAIFLKIPTMIHEQNVVPGKANKLLSRFVSKVAVSFEDSQLFFDLYKTVVTGCPCYAQERRSGVDKIFEKLKLKKGIKTILVLGGSQGSHRINEVFIKTIKQIASSQAVQVVHSCGGQDYEHLKEEYQKLSVHYALFKFIEDMNDVYSIADLVISRSGAVTVTEIACFGLPAVFIPYPHAYGHQKANAQVLEKHGPAVIVDEINLSVSRLQKEIIEKLENSSVSAVNYESIRRAVAESDKRIAKEIVGLE